MKEHRVPLIGLGVCAVLALGCVYSDNPWFTKKDVAFDPGLVGRWVATDDGKDDNPIELLKGPDDSYLFKEGKQEFSAFLVKIGGARYLDIVLKGKDEGKERIGHILMRVALEADSLTLNRMNSEWLAKAVEGKTIEVKADVQRRKGESEPEVRLTGTTEELQAFLNKHGSDLFKGGEQMKMKRVRK